MNITYTVKLINEHGLKAVEDLYSEIIRDLEFDEEYERADEYKKGLEKAKKEFLNQKKINT